MDKCFENKFVTVAERRFVLIHVGSVDVHFAAILEQTVCAECVRVGENASDCQCCRMSSICPVVI